MPIYTCKKCGYKVMSKNIRTRNMHPVEQDNRYDHLGIVALNMVSFVKVEDDKYKKEEKDVVIRISIDENTKTPNETLLNYLTLYDALSPEGKTRYLCGAIEGHKFDEGDSPPTA